MSLSPTSNSEIDPITLDSVNLILSPSMNVFEFNSANPIFKSFTFSTKIPTA